MRTPLRWVLLVAAAAILPSCGENPHGWLWVSVRNEGTGSSDVSARAEYSNGLGHWDEHLDVSVAPAETVKISFTYDDYLDRIVVRIYRSSDHVEIFSETWTRHQVASLHRLVSITVSP